MAHTKVYKIEFQKKKKKEMVNASPKSPEISSISENDERVLKNPLYTSPSALPLLEMHFSRQNGLSLLPNQMAVFSCWQLAARNA